jgi:hypothetical protein
MAITCKKSRAHLVQFLLREMSWISLHDMRSHVNQCEECSPLAGEFLDAVALLALSVPQQSPTDQKRLTLLPSLSANGLSTCI